MRLRKRCNFLLILFFFITLYTAGATGIEHPKVKWKFKTQGPIRSQPVADGESLYFCSADGNVYAVSKSTGDLIWKFQTQGALTSSPAVTASVVVVSSNDNFVYAINRTTGQLVWKFQTQPLLPSYWEWDYFTASPVVFEGNVFAGSGDGHLYKLDLQRGTLRWKFKTNGRIRTAPLVTTETIYLPSNDGKVYALATTDGKLRWQFATDGAAYDSRKFGWDRNSINASPVIQDSLMIIASRDGKTYAVNINTHKQKWAFTYGPTWAMSSAVEHNVAYIGWSDNSLLSAIDIQTGKEKWKFQSGSLVYTKPFLTDNDVFIGSADENIYCLKKATGEKRWAYKTNGCVYSSPIVVGNTVFAGSDDGYLYALEEGATVLKAVYHPSPTNAMLANAFTVDKKITPYLKEHGFDVLDSAALYRFLMERIRDQAPSVIVFSYEQIPSNMVGENPEQGMIRQYLQAGGKILWFGNTPNLYTFDSKGQPTMNVNTANEMLSINVVRPEESGNYYSKATQAGLNWGLPPWITATYATIETKDVIPLAFDEYGRVTIWLKKFNTRPGSGFISCRTWGWYAPIHDEDLALIKTLALHELE